MKTIQRLLLAMAWLLLAASTAQSQPPDAVGMAKRIELARRYYAAVHFTDTLDVMMKSMAPVLMAQQAQIFPNLTDAQRQLIASTTLEVMHDVSPQIVERLLPAVAGVFTEDELNQMVTFYEAPVGQAVVRKSPMLAAQVGPLVRDITPMIQTEMAKRLCAKLACPTGAPPKPPAPQT